MCQGNRNQLLINSYCQLRCQSVFDVEPGRWGQPYEKFFLEWLMSKICCQFFVCVIEQKMWLFYFKMQASFLIIVLMTSSWAQNSETGKRITAENQHAIIEQTPNTSCVHHQDVTRGTWFWLTDVPRWLPPVFCFSCAASSRWDSSFCSISFASSSCLLDLINNFIFSCKRSLSFFSWFAYFRLSVYKTKPWI